MPREVPGERASARLTAGGGLRVRLRRRREAAAEQEADAGRETELAAVRRVREVAVAAGEQ